MPGVTEPGTPNARLPLAAPPVKKRARNAASAAPGAYSPTKSPTVGPAIPLQAAVKLPPAGVLFGVAVSVAMDVVSAMLWLRLTATAIAALRNPTPPGPRTWTGIVLQTNRPHVEIGVPLPSWPELFRPQAQTVPSVLSARLCAKPAATAVAWLRPLTCTGTLVLAALPDAPLPSSPRVLSPQPQAVPSDRTARAWMVPAAIAVTPLRVPVPPGPTTCTGVAWLVQVAPSVQPLPSWPSPARPQAQSVGAIVAGSSVIAMLESLPAASALAFPLTFARNPTFPGPCTGTGKLLEFVLLLPSWPSPLLPQAQSDPSVRRARVWAPLAAMAVTWPSRPLPFGPTTCPGV